jgi:signal peptidase I
VIVGDTVRMTDGTTTRTHVVQNLAITGWDVVANTVSGTADEGAQLVVWPHEHDYATVYPIAGAGGAWTADFASVLFDLDYNMGGRAIIYDDYGNGTAVDWGIPEKPYMWIWIEWNSVDGHGWGLYEDVTLTIGDLILTENTGYGTDVHFEVGDYHDIVPGDLVVMSNGVDTKVMVVPPLVVTGYDLGANTVSGTYDPTLAFSIIVDDDPPLEVIFQDDTWTAIFAELLPLQWGGPWQTDADNDSAAATIRTPNPMFYVLPEENEIYAAEWTPGELLSVLVNGVEVGSQVVPYAGSLYGPEVAFFLNGIYDLQVGDVVVLSDGHSTKELFIPILQVTEYEPATQTISGIAAPGDLLVGVNGVDIWITVGEDGNWSVSSPEYEAGEWGSAIIWDGDGDQTRDNFMIPFP